MLSSLSIIKRNHLKTGLKARINLSGGTLVKKIMFVMLSGLVALSLTAGCQEKTPEVADQQKTETAPATTQPATQGTSGTVSETMNSGGYTYVQVDTGSEKIWAAAPQFQVAVGDPVVLPEGMPMEGYHSKTLDRTFDVLYFVDSVMVGGAQTASAQNGMPEGHPSPTVPAGGEGGDIDFSDVEKAEGGKTVAEIFAGKEELAGDDVTLRGKVVKFNPQIMGKNWLHVQDGTGGEGANDLTVTTSATAEVGDTVLVTGPLTTDKDFGHGYQYNVIVEDAEVTVE